MNSFATRVKPAATTPSAVPPQSNRLASLGCVSFVALTVIGVLGWFLSGNSEDIHPREPQPGDTVQVVIHYPYGLADELSFKPKPLAVRGGGDIQWLYGEVTIHEVETSIVRNGQVVVSGARDDSYSGLEFELINDKRLEGRTVVLAVSNQKTGYSRRVSVAVAGGKQIYFLSLGVFAFFSGLVFLLASEMRVKPKAGSPVDGRPLAIVAIDDKRP